MPFTAAEQIGGDYTTIDPDTLGGMRLSSVPQEQHSMFGCPSRRSLGCVLCLLHHLQTMSVSNGRAALGLLPLQQQRPRPHPLPGGSSSSHSKGQTTKPAAPNPSIKSPSIKGSCSSWVSSKVGARRGIDLGAGGEWIWAPWRQQGLNRSWIVDSGCERGPKMGMRGEHAAGTWTAPHVPSSALPMQTQHAPELSMQ